MVLVAVVMVGEVVATVQSLRTTPELSVIPLVPAVVHLSLPLPRLDWPSSGEAAVDVPGIGSLGSVGGSQPQPIASLTKMMTALVVQHDHPLAPGQDGPQVPVTQQDVDTYQSYVAQQNSAVAVSAGEQLSEKQALEALLVGSADNFALILARWDAGGERAFVSRMNAFAQAWGLSSTYYADSSGLSSATVSDAEDQLEVGERLLADPVLASIVAMPQVQIPVAGVVRNTNYVVGTDGIVGVKTGNTTQAGGCYVFAARLVRPGGVVSVVGAILGQGVDSPPDVTLPAAVKAGLDLLASVKSSLATATAWPLGRAVAVVRVPWGPPVPVRLARPVLFEGWGAQTVSLSFSPQPVGRTVAAHQVVGRLSAAMGHQSRQEVVRSQSEIAPPFSWRLSRL
jgi:D-alanyl-D-alanine carboxypeptidase (penicillin-binding protein 5/6)